MPAMPYNIVTASEQHRPTKGSKAMKYRVYNEQNIDTKRNMIFAHYTKTKKEAIAHAEKIGGNVVIERKIGCNWVKC